MFELVNGTDAKVALVQGWSLDGRVQSVAIAKLTLQFDLQGNLFMAEQEEVVLADEHYGDPRDSSLRRANEAVPFKQGAEYYLHGHACAPDGEQVSHQVSVSLEQNGLARTKQLAVLGEHQWQKGLLGHRRTEPLPFSRLPLRYELAFGGAHPEKGQREKRNPVGRGFNPSGWSLKDTRAPQIEYLGQAQLSPSRDAPVAGFAPLPSFWAPRQGRYGELSRQPLDNQGCPWNQDAHPALHHCAPEDQWLAAPLTGGEKLVLQGFFSGSEKPVELVLPTWRPQVLLVRRGHRAERIELCCDTLKIDTDRQTLSLIARAAVCPTQAKGLPAWLVLQASTSWQGAA